MLSSIGGYSGQWANGASSTVAVGGTGLLFIPPLLMILFREKYPRISVSPSSVPAGGR